eukprot:15474401-Alexandrium_andersonii.AAC.1
MHPGAPQGCAWLGLTSCGCTVRLARASPMSCHAFLGRGSATKQQREYGCCVEVWGCGVGAPTPPRTSKRGASRVRAIWRPWPRTARAAVPQPFPKEGVSKSSSTFARDRDATNTENNTAIAWLADRMPTRRNTNAAHTDVGKHGGRILKNNS